MTGLPNRRLFLDRLQRCFAEAQRDPTFRYAVLVLNLDGFKVFHDTMGTAAGDQVIVEVARRLEASGRGLDNAQSHAKAPLGDVILSRLSGDEFDILLERVSEPSEAMRVANSLQSDVAVPLTLNGREATITASIGIALNGTSQEHAEDLLLDAEDAMRCEKAMGGARSELFDTTGRVRLMNLRRFPVDTLKVDRSLVNNLLADRVSHDAIDLILTLAQKLDKKVVAEGVEKAAQVELLKALGCQLGQGYFFSQPLEAAQADELIREQSLSARAVGSPSS